MSDGRAMPPDRESEKGSWGEIFRDGRGLYSALVIGGIAMQATQMLVIAIIMPTIVADIGGAAYYTWAAMLYTIGAIVGASSTGVVWSRFGPRRGYTLGAGVFALEHGGLRARPQHRRADRGARRPRLGRRAGRRQRHGADHQPLRRAAAHPDHRDFARHLYRLSPERPDRRRLVRGDELVARLVLGDGAVHAALHRARLFEDPRPARHRGRAPPLSGLADASAGHARLPACSASPPAGR